MRNPPQRRSATSILASQSGLILTDFIFAIILTSGMSVLLFSLCYSLAVVEVTQYVSYSTARAHLAGNKDPLAQEAKARAKYTQLTTGRGAIGTLYQNGWFTVPNAGGIDVRSGVTGNGRQFSQDLAGGSDPSDRNWFLGVSIPLTIGMLKFNFPLLGNTAPDEDQGFQTRLNTMLIRDPSEKECRDFMQNRRANLGSLPSAQGFYVPDAYIPIEDNGC